MGKFVLSYSEETSYFDAVVENGHFRGHGCAYADPERLRRFAAELEVFPLRTASFENDRPGVINITVAASDTTGHFCITVELAEDERRAETVKCQLQAEYSEIAGIRQQVFALLNGGTTEIVFKELPTR